MKVISGLNNVKRIPPHTIAAIGVFDGIHRGHLAILKKVVLRAKYFKRKSLVITFTPRHCGVIKSNLMPRLLISLKHRLFLLERLGVDYCLVINFDRKFARISALEFVERFIIEALQLKEIYVGKDFRFGSARHGDINLLKKCGKRRGFKVRIVPSVKYKGKTVSSSWVRREIKRGNLKLVNRILGRPLSIYGRVVKGKGTGKRLGFPTANLDTERDIIPPNGVYAVRILYANKRYKGLLNIGLRPTFSARAHLTEEVHIFDFNGNLYCKFLEVELLRWVRPEKKFDTAISLVSAMKKDAIYARRILKNI